MRKIIMFMLLFFSVAAHPAVAVETNTCVFDALVVTSERGNLYRIDNQSSRVAFGVNAPLMRVEGEFEKFSGGIMLTRDGRGYAYSALIIYPKTINANKPIVASMLKGEEFFDVEQYPEIHFVNNGFKWVDNNTAIMQGDLTIRGITHSIVLDVKLSDITHDRILVSATTTINRIDYGMDAMSTVVDDEVDLTLSVEAHKYR